MSFAATARALTTAELVERLPLDRDPRSHRREGVRTVRRLLRGCVELGLVAELEPDVWTWSGPERLRAALAGLPPTADGIRAEFAHVGLWIGDRRRALERMQKGLAA